MSEAASDELGLMGGPFERKRPNASEGPDTGTGDRAKPAEPEMPREISASRSEGAPDFTTAAAAGELPPVQPTLAQASPDVPEAVKPVPELAGSDLQPVQDRDPHGGGPREWIPRDKPEAC
jgi:fused signal recognition particle receptor